MVKKEEDAKEAARKAVIEAVNKLKAPTPEEIEEHQKQADDELLKAVETPDPPLSPELQARAVKILASTAGANTDDEEVVQKRNAKPASADVSDGEAYSASSAASREVVDRSSAAAKLLRLIATAYPVITPNEHIVFGFGGHRFTLGDLRDLFALPRPR